MIKNGTLLMVLLLLFAWAVPCLLKADESHLYDFLWLDPDKSVYVLQNKVFKKEKSFYFDAGYIMGLSSDYQDTSGYNLSTGYYFTEEWGVELLYNKYQNKDNDALQSLRAINGSVPFSRKLNQTYGALAIWSPFYGKINTFNRIFYFDWSFGLGVANIDSESNANTVTQTTNKDSFQAENYTGGIGKTALRFYINKNIHLGMTYQRTMYQAPGPRATGETRKNKWRGNSDVLFSVGFSF